MKINQPVTLTPPKTEKYSETNPVVTKSTSPASDLKAPSFQDQAVASKYEAAPVGIPRTMAQVKASTEAKETVPATKAVEVQTKALVETPKEESWLSKAGTASLNFVKRAGSAGKTVVTGTGDAVVGVAKNTVNAVVTMGQGVVTMATGHPIEGSKQIGMGVLKGVVQTPVDATIMLAGKAVSGVQTLVGLEPVGRKLTGSEVAVMQKVYGNTIDFSKVDIKEGNAGILGVSGRPYVLGNTIYMPSRYIGDTKTLVHEMMHIWQHQNGGTNYLSEALVGQYLGDGYNFQKGIAEGKPFAKLNPEQQAELIEIAYGRGFFDTSGATFSFFYNGKWTDATDYLNEAVKQVRQGKLTR